MNANTNDQPSSPTKYRVTFDGTVSTMTYDEFRKFLDETHQKMMSEGRLVDFEIDSDTEFDVDVAFTIGPLTCQDNSTIC